MPKAYLYPLLALAVLLVSLGSQGLAGFGVPAAVAAGSAIPAASPRPVSTPSPAVATANEDELVDAIAAALKPAVSTFTRDVYVWHWSTRGVTGMKNDDTSIQNETTRKYMIERLKSKNPGTTATSGAAGAGLYAAIDPVATRSYGGSWYRGSAFYSASQSPIAIEMKLEEGRRFIRQDDLSRITLPAAVSKYGCQQGGDYFVTDDYNEKCRALRQKVFAKLDVVGMSYSYNATSFNKQCSGSYRSQAFVLFDPSLADGDWFTHQVNLPKPQKQKPAASSSPIVPDDIDPKWQSRRIMNQLFELAGYGSGYSSGGAIYDDKELAGSKLSDKELEAWMQEHLMTCGDHPEDGYWRNGSANAPVLKAREDKLLAKAAEVSKAIGVDIKLDKMRGLYCYYHSPEIKEFELPEGDLEIDGVVAILRKLWKCEAEPGKSDTGACTTDRPGVPAIFEPAQFFCKIQGQAFEEELTTDPLKSIIDELETTFQQIPANSIDFLERVRNAVEVLLTKWQSPRRFEAAAAILNFAFQKNKNAAGSKGYNDYLTNLMSQWTAKKLVPEPGSDPTYASLYFSALKGFVPDSEKNDIREYMCMKGTGKTKASFDEYKKMRLTSNKSAQLADAFECVSRYRRLAKLGDQDGINKLTKGDSECALLP